MADALYDADLNGAAIHQVSSGRISPGNQIRAGRASGAIDPSALYLVQGNPRHQLVSSDLAGVLTAVSATQGLNVASGSGTFPLNKRVDGSTFAGATSHFTLTAASYFSWISSFSCGQGEDAQINLETWFRSSDGLTAPVAANTGQSLSAESYNALWTMAVAKLNTGGGLAQVTGLQRITVNTGIRVEPQFTDGAIFPTAFYLTQRDPSMDFLFIDADKAATYGPLFLALTAVQAFFQKRAEGSSLIDPLTAVHVEASFADGINDVQEISGQGNSDATIGFRVMGEALTVGTTATF